MNTSLFATIMKTYTSKLDPVPVVENSVYTHILRKDKQHEESSVVYIDAASGRKLTRGDVRRLTHELAWGLLNELPKHGGPGLQRGDTVLIFSPNTFAYPFVLFGLLAAGFKATLANSAYQPAELAHQFTDSGAKVILAHPALLPVVLRMFELLKIDEKEAPRRIILVGWNLEDKGPAGFLQLAELLGKGSIGSEEIFDGSEANTTALLCYSSGTTGKPKGVETTHKNIGTMVNMLVHILEFGAGDTVMGVLPFYHIYGAVNLLLYCFYCNVPVVIMTAFEPVGFCKYIAQYQVTIALVVPPILVVLARHPAAAQYSMKSLRLLISGAAPLRAPLVKAVSDRLKSLGSDPAIIQGYGLTETSPTTHAVPTEFATEKVGSIGILLSNLEARLVDDDGHEVPEGEPGELWVQGPSIMKGYHNNPSATKDTMSEDGFFKTGDIAVVDEDGFFSIVDRRKELIKYKGFQVPPAELEATLLQHPDIADSGVIGVESHEEATEYPRAYVVHGTGLSSDSEKETFGKSVQKWIEGRVAKHKHLRGGVKVIDAIPKSAAGKILRRELRERAKIENVEYVPRAKL